jgi:hypothetical protein
MAQAKTVTLIATSDCTGKGTPEDFCRRVYQLWTLDGKLVAQMDHGPRGDDQLAVVTQEIEQLVP